MPFDDTPISNIRQHVDFGELVLAWDSSAADDALYQVYAQRKLVWWGHDRQVSLPYPGEWTWFDIGVVGPDEGPIDFSASLDPIPGGGNRVRLEWWGGSYLEPDRVAAFRVYGEATPGGGLEGIPLVELPAYIDAPPPDDGFGVGGFGRGGFGRSGWFYQWESTPLGPGTWTFAVKAVDDAGNESLLETCAPTIAGPPLPPAPDPTTGLRLSYTYNSTTHVATLSWLASPAS